MSLLKDVDEYRGMELTVSLDSSHRTTVGHEIVTSSIRDHLHLVRRVA